MSNDYINALNAYDKTNKSGLSDPREIEVRALYKSAESLETLQQSWESTSLEEKENLLRKNEKLWTIFTAEMEKEDTGLDLSIRSNIANLGLFIFKRTMEIRTTQDQKKIDILISINRNIAAGLQDSINLTKKQQSEGTATPSPYGQQQSQSSTEQTPPTSPTDIDV